METPLADGRDREGGGVAPEGASLQDRCGRGTDQPGPAEGSEGEPSDRGRVLPGLRGGGGRARHRAGRGRARSVGPPDEAANPQEHEGPGDHEAEAGAPEGERSPPERVKYRRRRTWAELEALRIERKMRYEERQRLREEREAIARVKMADEQFDGRPKTYCGIFEQDPLLAALVREHGRDGRPDLVDIEGHKRARRKRYERL